MVNTENDESSIIANSAKVGKVYDHLKQPLGKAEPSGTMKDSEGSNCLFLSHWNNGLPAFTVWIEKEFSSPF